MARTPKLRSLVSAETLVGAALVAVAIPQLVLGPGTDLDVGAVFASGRLIIHGDYRPSRPPGAPVHEAIVGVLDRVGGTTLSNVATLIAALAVVAAVTELARRAHLPRPFLVAAVVVANPWFIVAATSTVDFPMALAFLLWGAIALQRGRDGLAVCMALLGVLAGIGIAVALSILNVFRRTWWPYQTELGRVSEVAGYHDVRSYPAAERMPGMVIYRFDAPLIFANAKTFRDAIVRLAKAEPKPKWIVIAAEPITDVDTTASDVLEELDEFLNGQGINLVFAELKDPVRRKIERYGLTRTIDPSHFFPTVDSAADAFRADAVRQREAAASAPAGLAQSEPIPAKPKDG
jgi:MFS superfamily sulfate permease-like transporter